MPAGTDGWSAEILLAASMFAFGTQAAAQPVGVTELDRQAAYCASMLDNQRILSAEDGNGGQAPQLGGLGARFEQYLTGREKVLGAGALRNEGRRMVMEDAAKFFNQAAKANCFRPGREPDQACLLRAKRASGIPERQAACGDPSWLPSEAAPNGAVDP